MKNTRNLFDELMEGLAAMKSHREGKLKLRSYKVESAPQPEQQGSDDLPDSSRGAAGMRETDRDR